MGNLYRSQTDDGAMATVQATFGVGLCCFDIVPLYGFGLAEHRIGAVLRRIARPAVLSTKAGWRLDRHNAGDAPGGTADNLFEYPAPFKPRIDHTDPRIRGVVGWIGMEARDAPDRLAALVEDPLLRGIRPMWLDIPDRLGGAGAATAPHHGCVPITAEAVPL